MNSRKASVYLKHFAVPLVLVLVCGVLLAMLVTPPAASVIGLEDPIVGGSSWSKGDVIAIVSIIDAGIGMVAFSIQTLRKPRR